MKKIVFTTVFLFVAVSITFAQKKTVKAAANEIKGMTPNIGEARTLIKDALTNPESAEDAETWFVAGNIENKQFDVERTKEILGKQPNDGVMYGALSAIWPYYQKALQFDLRPDEKGKVKLRFTKDIRSIMLANRSFYPNAGIYYYDNKDFKRAYENFKMYGDYKKMDIFKDEKWTVADSIENQIKYYAGLSASYIPNHPAAIEIYEEIKDSNVSNPDEIYRSLAEEYLQIEDTVSYEKTLDAGFKKFPGVDYFLRSLIDQNINSGKLDKAITLLDIAIEKHPTNPQFYDVLGQVYELDKKTDNALKYMKKALELRPDSLDYLTHIGRVYFNLGVEKRGEADRIKDAAQYKSELQKSMDYFKEALPYFEKAFDVDPKSATMAYTLVQIYYTLGMGEKLEKMEKLYNELK